MDKIQLTFWGTRGSLPCSGPQYTHYGGNTACVEIECGGRTLVFDGGSGIRGLGERLSKNLPERIDLLFSHYHFDHICGLPFFAPFAYAGVEVHLWGGQSEEWLTTSDMLDGFMKPPFFPITPSAFRASLGFHDFRAGDTLKLSDEIEIKTAPLLHPQGATGYCIHTAGKKICYVTDTEMTPDGKPTQEMIDLIDGAEFLVLDAMFTDEELDMCKGWGHSSWRQCVELANKANIKTLVLFHHHPHHDDKAMAKIAAEAEAARPGTLVAREGQTFTL